MKHELKTHPEYFKAVWAGSKPWEIRKHDRLFAVDDLLELQEFDPDPELLEAEAFSGRAIVCVIERIWVDLPGLDPEYCILGIRITALEEDFV